MASENANAEKASSTTSTDTSMNEKKSPNATTATGDTPSTKRSLFRRATSKLRSAVCLPSADDQDAQKPSTSSDLASGADKKDEQEAKDENKKDSKDDKPEDQTMKTEFKHLDRKYDDEDKPYFIARKKEDIDVGEKKDWWQLFAFCVVRRWDSDGDLDETCLYVNPQPLRQLLKDVIGNYPSDPINIEDVQITAPYHSLFHYRKPLEEVGLKRFEDAGDDQTLEQLKLLLDWIRTNFELEIAAHDRCLQSDSKAVAYDKLWTLFAPGTIVHAKVNSHHRLFRVVNYSYDEDDDPEPGFNVYSEFVDYDGEDFGNRRVDLAIRKYGGTREVSAHEVRPLAFVEDAAEIREALLARGKRFAELAAGQHFVEYKGIALKRNPRCPARYLRFDATGRVMVDCKTYHRLDANDMIWTSRFDKDHGEGLSEEDMLLANASVRGYSMGAKKFLEFDVEKISPVKWNSQCFEELVLDDGTKKTVQALVSTHSGRNVGSSEDDDHFDDIVRGKGKGLVCVLHGPPGVGKTLTAECVAEYVQRPLFMVSSGDLGVSSEQLDEQLTKIMDMTSTWRAVLLIDEADVFLEQRALHDLHRNCMSQMVSLFSFFFPLLFPQLPCRVDIRY